MYNVLLIYNLAMYIFSFAPRSFFSLIFIPTNLLSAKVQKNERSTKYYLQKMIFFTSNRTNSPQTNDFF